MVAMTIIYMIIKECNYIEKKVVRHIIDNLSDFSSSDETDKEYIKMYFLRERFFKRAILKESNEE